MLTVSNVSVDFGPLAALDRVSISADAGRVTGLIGPNGAGKTTLFNVISGLQQPKSGSVHLDGNELIGLPVHRRARLGLARTFQRLETFGSLTVRENLMVGADIRRRWSGEKSKPLHVADEILQRVGLGDVADEPIDALPTGLARLSELGRALASRPKILLLDEPGSGLDATESEDLARLLSELAREDGLAVLIVEHDMDLVMAVCQHIHVLDFGTNIADGTGAEIKANERVQTAYLGSAASRPRRVRRSWALCNGGPR